MLIKAGVTLILQDHDDYLSNPFLVLKDFDSVEVLNRVKATQQFSKYWDNDITIELLRDGIIERIPALYWNPSEDFIVDETDG